MTASGDKLVQRLPRLWFQRRLAPALFLLLPFSWLFSALGALRRFGYRVGLKTAQRLPVPVIVVGNLTVGGSGKTPLVLWLAAQLRAAGFLPGIISRGYARDGRAVLAVNAQADATVVGDEPLLLARRSGVPVFVGRDRAAAGRALLAMHPECNVLIADDGLQHYRLARDVEIAVFDARGAGNRCLLPAGPLREPLARLGAADAVVWNGAPAGTPARDALQACGRQGRNFDMVLRAQHFVHLRDAGRHCSAADLQDKRLCAIAGIGDPERFFKRLSALGLSFEKRAFPDHHAYVAEDLLCDFGTILLMTEKDAVKCAPLPMSTDAWVLPVAAEILSAPDGATLLATILEKLNHGRASA